MDSNYTINAGILAGGLGRRMDGQDKGLIEFRGQRMCATLVTLLQPWTNDVLINANRNIEQYQRLSPLVIEDKIGDFSGPLAGIYTLLSTTQSDYLLLCPCDTPLLNSHYPERMIKAVDQMEEQNLELAVACLDGQPEPLHLLLNKSCIASIEHAIQLNHLSVKRWLTQRSYLEIDFSDELASFRNLNRPEDIDQSSA